MELLVVEGGAVWWPTPETPRLSLGPGEAATRYDEYVERRARAGAAEAFVLGLRRLERHAAKNKVPFPLVDPALIDETLIMLQPLRKVVQQ